MINNVGTDENMDILIFLVVMVDTDDSVWHKLPSGELLSLQTTRKEKDMVGNYKKS